MELRLIDKRVCNRGNWGSANASLVIEGRQGREIIFKISRRSYSGRHGERGVCSLHLPNRGGAMVKLRGVRI